MRKTSAATREKAARQGGEKQGMPLFARIFYLIAALSLAVYLIAVFSPRFAAFFTGTVGAFLRSLLAHLTSFLPFSLAAVLLLASPLLVVGVGIHAWRRQFPTWRDVFLYLGSVVSVFALLFSVFVCSIGTAYHTPTLFERMELAEESVNAQALGELAEELVPLVNDAAHEVSFGENGFSRMPYGLDGMNDRLLLAYDRVCGEYDFIQSLQSRVKPVLVSKLMSYTHITGVYSFYTGEANLNTYFPDYTLPFTAAHELAHQRGIAREEEANFVAFLVAAASDDAYIRYCGYLNLFEYVAGALYRADRDAYAKVLGTLDPLVLGELAAFSDFFEEFRDSAISDVSDKVNDTYLKLHGNEAGSASYGLVVRLAVAYFKKS